MTMLNQLKTGDIARIVCFKNCSSEYKNKFFTKGVSEGSIIRIISCFGLITFCVISKILSVSYGIAENVRVIKIQEYNKRER